MGSENYEIAAEELRKDEKKLAQMIKKQEKVLFVSFHLLLNLAEDLQIERKMKNISPVIHTHVRTVKLYLTGTFKGLYRLSYSATAIHLIASQVLLCWKEIILIFCS